MSDETKPKRVRNSKPLGAGEAFDLIAERRETRAESRAHRIAECAKEFDRVEQVFEEHTRNRVPEAQRARLDRMLATAEPATANDPAPAPDEPTAAVEPETTSRDTDWLKEPVPPVKGRTEVDRSERKTGRAG